MGEPCNICGDVGFAVALRTCSQCNIIHEHAYCRGILKEDSSEYWICELCEIGTLDSKRHVQKDFLETPFSKPSSMVEYDTIYSASRRKVPKRELIVKTGKVKCLPSQEAIRLSSGSSGAKKFISLSKNILHSKNIVPTKSRQEEIVESNSARTPFKPKFRPPKPSSLSVKLGANASFRSSEPLCRTYGNTPSNCPPTSATKEDKVANNVKCGSSPLMQCPPTVSSGGNYCTNMELRKSDAVDDLMHVHTEKERCLLGPAQESSWKGSFEIHDNYEGLKDGFHAHPPYKVPRKVYEFSKKMPEVLQFRLLPRYKVWTDIFQDDIPGDDDIGLYFFSSNSHRSLLEIVETQDLVMRSYMDGVELLVFTSKHLSANSQRWNGEYFLWGVFRRVKKHKTPCKLIEEPPLLLQSNGDADVVDMEIDMIAGTEVGTRDVVSRESSRSYGSLKQENANKISLHRSDMNGTLISRTLGFTIQQPSPEIEERGNGIPPGFEEIYRQRFHENALTETESRKLTSWRGS